MITRIIAESVMEFRKKISAYWFSTRLRSNSFLALLAGKSSTIIPGAWPSLVAFNLSSDLAAELPFTLMHPKPVEDDRPSSSSGSHKSESSVTKENGESAKATGVVDDLVDTNLIQLDT